MTDSETSDSTSSEQSFSSKEWPTEKVYSTPAYERVTLQADLTQPPSQMVKKDDILRPLQNHIRKVILTRGTKYIFTGPEGSALYVM